MRMIQVLLNHLRVIVLGDIPHQVQSNLKSMRKAQRKIVSASAPAK
jgi:hypothetical protein